MDDVDDDIFDDGNEVCKAKLWWWMCGWIKNELLILWDDNKRIMWMHEKEYTYIYATLFV